MKNKQYYIGLMSGTSADGIDLALVDFSKNSPEFILSDFQPYTDSIRASVTQLYNPSNNEIDLAFALDKQLAQAYAACVNNFLKRHNIAHQDIMAIGNHGQTIRHRPQSSTFLTPFTVQLGCNQTLACLTGIDVIGQFRQKDIALGGQGAPLVPAFHRQLVQAHHKDTFIVNIGGIANITYLPVDSCKEIVGFDTGPGNALLDDWYQHHHQELFDENGAWGNTGNINTALLELCLAEPYFKQSLPKSTGRELFNMAWLNDKLSRLPQTTTGHLHNIPPENIQATLCMLTAESISNDIKALGQNGDVYLCGGGSHNALLVKYLQQQLATHYSLNAIDSLGINNDALEAMAFAWLAYAYKKNIPSNMPSVTGASKSTTLGVLFKP